MRLSILRKSITGTLIGVALLIPMSQTAFASQKDILKLESRGNDVVVIQKQLKSLGFFNADTTGYFGAITKKAVVDFQKANKLISDGIVGPATYSKLFESSSNQNLNSRGSTTNPNGLVPWFGGVEDIFRRDSNALVTDVLSGITFSVRRTGGYNHADVEPLTKEDTNKLFSVYGSRWKWDRRAVVVEAGGIKIAGSIAGMPHEYDRVSGNGVKGHFDIHFLNSRSHGTNKVNGDHQQKVKEAAAFLGK